MNEPSGLREVARGLRFPEGPIALPDGSFLVVEIERGCLSRISADGHVEPVAFTGGGPNGAAIGPDGKCYVCNNGGHIWREDEHGLRPIGPSADYVHGWVDRIDLATGAIERLHESSDRGPLRSPNDIVFDRTGGFWFTDLGKGRKNDLDRGAVCYAPAGGGSVRRAIFPMLSPNGIGLSHDESTLYVAETQTARLWAFEISSPGVVNRIRWPESPNGGRFLAGSSTFQMFDSLAVDSAGNICVATVANGGITVVSPDGSDVRHVRLPDHLTTNICFGGPRLATAYVTLSSSGKLGALRWPSPGMPLNFLNA